MITVSLGEALSPGITPEDEEGFSHCIYVVKAEHEVLYVGQSYAPRERLRQHVYSDSRLGVYIRELKPSSLDWQVDLYTLRDFGMSAKSIYANEQQFRTQARQVEDRLIKEYRPLLNY